MKGTRRAWYKSSPAAELGDDQPTFTLAHAAAGGDHVAASEHTVWLRENRLAILESLLPGVAHEINNHDQSILLAAQVIEGAWGDLAPILDRVQEREGDFLVGGLEYSSLRQEMPEYVGHLVDGARSIQALVSEMRSFLRGSDKQGATDVDLNRLIEGSLLIMSHRIRRSTDRLEKDLAPDLPVVRTQAGLFAQALFNTVEHACRSLAGRQHPVRVSTIREQGRLVCAVAAQGCRPVGGCASRLHAQVSGPEPEAADQAPEGLAAAAWIMKRLGGSLELTGGDADVLRLVLPVADRGR